MIVLFTDFGPAGPYLGQMEAVLAADAPGVPVINLLADAPLHNPRAAAYLLAAYAESFPPGTVFLGVVDPGVGGSRTPAVLLAAGRWYVGPDNGLFEIARRRGGDNPRWWEIVWQPDSLSPTFHGRDLFAPVAARVAALAARDHGPGDGPGDGPGEWPGDWPGDWQGCRERRLDGGHRTDSDRGDRGEWADWPDDLGEIVYVDHFGNAVTGQRAKTAPKEGVLCVGGHALNRSRTFSQVPEGKGFWYENANGLVEIAVNRGRAHEALDIGLGTPIAWEPS